MSAGKYSFKELLIIILHEGLLGAGTNIIRESVGDAMMKSGLIKSSELAGIVLASAFTGDNKGDDVNPLVQAENIQKDINPRIPRNRIRCSSHDTSYILGFITERICFCGKWIYVN